MLVAQFISTLTSFIGSSAPKLKFSVTGAEFSLELVIFPLVCIVWLGKLLGVGVGVGVGWGVCVGVGVGVEVGFGVGWGVGVGTGPGES